MSRIQAELENRTFDRLTVIRRVPDDRFGAHRWECVCACGKKVFINGGSLLRGLTKSCGCRRREVTIKRSTKHGRHGRGSYGIWKNMNARCSNKNRPDYKNYGGRGIAVCAEWKTSFEAFVSEMGDCPRGLELDRIDNEKGYCKENCRWVTRKTNVGNRRLTKFLEIEGKKITLAKCAEKYGFKYSTLNCRIFKYGWSVKRAISEPLIPIGKYKRTGV